VFASLAIRLHGAELDEHARQVVGEAALEAGNFLVALTGRAWE
jgi:hypothetical protein